MAKGKRLTDKRYIWFRHVLLKNFDIVYFYDTSFTESKSAVFSKLENICAKELKSGVLILEIEWDPTIYRAIPTKGYDKALESILTEKHYFWTLQGTRTYNVEMRYCPPWYDEFVSLTRKIDKIAKHKFWGRGRVLPPAPFMDVDHKINWQPPQAIGFQNEWGYFARIVDNPQDSD